MSNRTRGILTDTDREFLRNDDYYDGENARQMRYQRRRDIRGRIMSSLLDFNMIANHLSDDEREKIFSEPVKNGAENELEFRAALEALLGWIYLGCRPDDVDIDFDKLLTEGVLFGEEQYYYKTKNERADVSVDFEVNVEQERTDLSELAKKIEEGELVHARDIYKLPTLGSVSVDSEKVDVVRVRSSRTDMDSDQERRMVQNILSEMLSIEPEVEIEEPFPTEKVEMPADTDDGIEETRSVEDLDDDSDQM